MSEQIESVLQERVTDVPSVRDVLQETADLEPVEKRVIVGVPAYNEEIGIGSVVLATQQYADRVVVVDDGSSDETARIARQAGAEVVEHETNYGKGRAVRTMFEYLQSEEFDAFVMIDGDGQHTAEDLPEVTEPVLAGDADIVIGSRYLEFDDEDETPRYRRFGQQVLDRLTGRASGADLTDTQSGFRAFTPDAVTSLELRSDGMTVESEMIDSAVREELTIEERPISVRYDGIDGQTLNPMHHGLSVTLFVLKMIRDRHPLAFFGLPGLVLLLAGTGVGLHSAIVYQSTGVFHSWRVLVAGLVTIIGVLGVFCGLILNRISNMISELEVKLG